MGVSQNTMLPRARRRRSSRRDKIVVESARLFVEKGFDATSMRDIAAATGMNAGSLYYHFKSKEQLFVAAHSAGVQSLVEAVTRRIDRVEGAWARLEAAAAAHAAALFESADLMVLLVPKFPAAISDFREQLIQQRNEYEQIIRALVADLRLREDVDREVFRLHFLGALNWTQTWYRPGFRLSAEEIGRQLVRMLRGSEDISRLK